MMFSFISPFIIPHRLMQNLEKKLAESIIVMIIMFCWTAALYYHTLNGIRHLFWDMGKGFSIKAMHKTAYLVILLTVMLTIFSWYLVITSN